MEANTHKLFVNLASYLGTVLGEDYEVVVHSVNKERIENSEIIAIENGHISRRTVHSPLTDLALNMIKNKDYQHSDFKTNYKAVTKDGIKMNGSTFFIKDEQGELEGLLCINHDTSKIQRIASEILSLSGQSFTNTVEVSNDSVEMLSSSVEDIVYSVVDPVFLNQDMVLSPKQKEQVITTLYEKGVFAVKGSVQKVAKLLRISEPTVYRYLKEM